MALLPAEEPLQLTETALFGVAITNYAACGQYLILLEHHRRDLKEITDNFQCGLETIRTNVAASRGHLIQSLIPGAKNQKLATEFQKMRSDYDDVLKLLDRWKGVGAPPDPDVDRVPKKPTTPAVRPDPRKTHNWRLLKRGMTKAQVMARLGAPSSKSVNSLFELWYYDLGEFKRGSVTLDENGVVTGWDEP